MDKHDDVYADDLDRDGEDEGYDETYVYALPAEVRKQQRLYNACASALVEAVVVDDEGEA